MRGGLSTQSYSQFGSSHLDHPAALFLAQAQLHCDMVSGQALALRREMAKPSRARAHRPAPARPPSPAWPGQPRAAVRTWTLLILAFVPIRGNWISLEFQSDEPGVLLAQVAQPMSEAAFYPGDVSRLELNNRSSLAFDRTAQSLDRSQLQPGGDRA